MVEITDEEAMTYGLISAPPSRNALAEAKLRKHLEDPDIPYNTVEEFLYYLDYKADRSKALQRQQLENRIKGVNKQTLLITLSFDMSMNEEEAIKEMDKSMELFKQSNYKWLKNGAYTYEFYSGRQSIWNPHIHICSDRIGVSASQVRQAIDRSPCRKKTRTYNCNVVVGTDDQHERYVLGNKKESKEENVKLDNEFREKWKIKSHYIL
jgi:hypothetical protein